MKGISDLYKRISEMQKEISFFRVPLKGVDAQFFLRDSEKSLKPESVHQGIEMKVSMAGKKCSVSLRKKKNSFSFLLNS